jgi:hypothetical protein
MNKGVVNTRAKANLQSKVKSEHMIMKYATARRGSEFGSERKKTIRYSPTLIIAAKVIDFMISENLLALRRSYNSTINIIHMMGRKTNQPGTLVRKNSKERFNQSLLAQSNKAIAIAKNVTSKSPANKIKRLSLVFKRQSPGR